MGRRNPLSQVLVDFSAGWLSHMSKALPKGGSASTCAGLRTPGFGLAPQLHRMGGAVEFISLVLTVAALIFLCLGIAGIIQPAWFKGKKTGEVPTRAQLGCAGLFVAFLFAAIAAVVLPEERAAPSKEGPTAQLNSDGADKGEQQQAVIDRLSGMTGDELDTSNVQLPDCEQSSKKISIEVISWGATEKICRAYHERFGVYPQVRIMRRISKVASLLSIKQYEPGEPIGIAQSIMTIMKDRKQSDPIAQMRTTEFIWKMEAGWEGAVSIADLHDFLRTSGDMAFHLSDEGLLHMAAMIKEEKAR